MIYGSCDSHVRVWFLVRVFLDNQERAPAQPPALPSSRRVRHAPRSEKGRHNGNHDWQPSHINFWTGLPYRRRPQFFFSNRAPHQVQRFWAASLPSPGWGDGGQYKYIKCHTSQLHVWSRDSSLPPTEHRSLLRCLVGCHSHLRRVRLSHQSNS